MSSAKHCYKPEGKKLLLNTVRYTQSHAGEKVITIDESYGAAARSGDGLEVGAPEDAARVHYENPCWCCVPGFLINGDLKTKVKVGVLVWGLLCVALVATLIVLLSLLGATLQRQYSKTHWISSTQVELIPPNRKDAYKFSSQLCVSTSLEYYSLYYLHHNIVVKLSQDDCQLPLTNNTVEITSHFVISGNSHNYYSNERRYMAFFWTKGTSVSMSVEITSNPPRKVGNANLLVDLYEMDSYKDYDACKSYSAPYMFLSRKTLTFNTSQNCTPYLTYTLCTFEYIVSETGSRYLCFLTKSSQEGLEFTLQYTLTITEVFYGHDGNYPQSQETICHLNTSSRCCQPYGALMDTKSSSCVYLITNVSEENYNIDSARVVPIMIETIGDYSLVYLVSGILGFEMVVCFYCMYSYVCIRRKHKVPLAKGCVCKWDI